MSVDPTALTDAQLDTKIAKLYGWKLVGRKWWHDEFGDGPPPSYTQILGRAAACYRCNTLEKIRKEKRK